MFMIYLFFYLYVLKFYILLKQCIKTIKNLTKKYSKKEMYYV